MVDGKYWILDPCFGIQNKRCKKFSRTRPRQNDVARPDDLVGRGLANSLAGSRQERKGLNYFYLLI